MAGSDPRFPYAKFREAILFAMRMANPNTSAEEATFIWETENTFARPDASGRPFVWEDAPVTSVTESTPTHVDCIVEFVARVSQEQQTSVGEFTPSRVVVYLFGEEYAIVKNAVRVKVGGNTYKIKSVGATISLFEMDMYPIYAEALDES